MWGREQDRLGKCCGAEQWGVSGVGQLRGGAGGGVVGVGRAMGWFVRQAGGCGVFGAGSGPGSSCGVLILFCSGSQWLLDDRSVFGPSWSGSGLRAHRR